METPISDCDWELVGLPNSDETHHSSSAAGGGVIQSDYFSLESELNYTATFPDDADGGDSDNLSWVDPNDISVVRGNKGKRSRSRSPRSSCSSYPSSSDSGDRNLLDLIQPHSGCCGGSFEHGEVSDCVSKSLKIVENSDGNDVEMSSVIGFSEKGGVDEIFSGSDHVLKLSEVVENSYEISSEIRSSKKDGVDEQFSGSDHFSKSSVTVKNSGDNDVEMNSVIGSSGKDGVDEQLSALQVEGDVEMIREQNESETENENENEKRLVWWKVPMEVLKYWVLRVRPVWSLSMVAAALMGFVILRRRYLQKVKHKSIAIQRNVTVDDKKVSQIMSRVARLNEAFSVVKRVPIIRPALPAPGMAPWPVMSLR